jgi:CMP-N,N'-diacetyllegionaminic acid synthase
MKKNYRIIALIPARSGSKRFIHKNIYPLNGHPLLAYAISSAINSNVFSKIIVSTDSKKYKKIAEYYGAEVPFLRPKNISGSKSSDYDWIKYTLNKLEDKFDVFVILRPTNPFRNEFSIKRSLKKFFLLKMNYSIRAISFSKNHPGKMWYKKGKFILPVLRGFYKNQPFYNSQFACLPKIYQQNASMEISKTNVIKKFKTLTTKKIIPYFSNEYEGFDINYSEDIKFIKKKYFTKLTKISKKSYFKKSN